MMSQTGDRNQRALVVGAMAAAVILLLTYVVTPWVEVRQRLEKLEGQLSAAGGESVREQAYRLRLARAVPAFAMPGGEDAQRLRFLRSFSEQVKQAGLGLAGMPQYRGQSPVEGDLGVKLLRLECQGKCKVAQALDVLARLYENPDLVAVEEMALRCVSDNREDWELSLTVSTFAEQEEGS